MLFILIIKHIYPYFGQSAKSVQLPKQKQNYRALVCKLFMLTQNKHYAPILVLLYFQDCRRLKHYYELKEY